MFFKKKKNQHSVLGVEINREQLKIVELKPVVSSRYDFQITNYVVEDLPRGIFYNNDKIESEQMGEIIKEIADRERMRGKRVVCAVPFERTVKKAFSVPIDSTENEIENLIKNSAKKYTPNGIEAMAFDFYERDDMPKSEEEKFMMLEMCPLEAVTSREDSLLIGDLTPLVIETDDKPINRLSPTFINQYESEIGQQLDNKKDAYMIVEVRKNNVFVITMFNNQVESTKEHIIKRTVDSQKEIFDQILDCISKDLFITQAQSKLEKVSAIFLSGQNKTLFSLREFMEEDSTYDDLEILIANPLFNIEFEGVNFEDVMAASPSLVLACGLAMREVSKYE